MKPETPPPPVVTRAVVEHLEEAFPDECPEGADPYPWHIKQGQLEVVRYVRRLYDQQQEG